jgi:DNA-binding transcriptional MocR family regulator
MDQKKKAITKKGQKFISERTLSEMWDCHRSTIGRILEESGIRPYYFGKTKNGLKRYALSDVEAFIDKSRSPGQKS